MWEKIIQTLTTEGKWLLSILVAGVLGFIIGFERKNRSKEAGIRTHAIVCLGSALLMIVSRFGFGGGDADSARVAAPIVSGIGFLGAGMIIYRKKAVQGLTTAAGIWATAGIGMACGGELYVVAIGTTVLLVAVQYILHLKFKIFATKKTFELKIVFIQTNLESEKIKELFGITHFHRLQISKTETQTIYTAHLVTKSEFRTVTLDKILKENPFITYIERCEEE
jgi:putative Mg2+ transporter-C (MgtC) family protein